MERASKRLLAPGQRTLRNVSMNHLEKLIGRDGNKRQYRPSEIRNNMNYHVGLHDALAEQAQRLDYYLKQDRQGSRRGR